MIRNRIKLYDSTLFLVSATVRVSRWLNQTLLRKKSRRNVSAFVLVVVFRRGAFLDRKVSVLECVVLAGGLEVVAQVSTDTVITDFLSAVNIYFSVLNVFARMNCVMVSTAVPIFSWPNVRAL